MRTKDKIYTNLKMEKIQNYDNLGTIGAIPIFETNTTILTTQTMKNWKILE